MLSRIEFLGKGQTPMQELLNPWVLGRIPDFTGNSEVKLGKLTQGRKSTALNMPEVREGQ